MPSVVRRTETNLTEKRHEVVHAVGWQVRHDAWSPATDVYETETEFVVRAEAAGVRESDFEAVFEEGVLLISGVRLDVSERRAYHQLEIPFGKFFVAIAIPGAVELDGSEAVYKDGFLIVHLPKARPTSVKIEE